MCINILIDCDNHYVWQTCCAIYSLIKNSNNDFNIKIFYVYYSGSEIKNITKRIKKILRKEDELILISVERPKIKINYGRWNDQIILRILGLLKLPNDIDTVLRIDGDVIVDGNIADIYKNLDNSKAINGTKEWLSWTSETINRLNLKSGIYLNSGVIVIDVKKAKNKLKTESNILSIIKEKQAILKAIDQDFLNIVFDDDKNAFKNDKYMRFCATYHTIPDFYKSESPIIYHYAGPIKPWDYRGIINYRKIYHKYWLHTFPFCYVLKIKILRFMWLVKNRKREKYENN